VGTDKRERQKANRQQKQIAEARAERRRGITRKTLIWGVTVAALFVVLVIIAVSVSSDDDAPPIVVPTSEVAGSEVPAGTVAGSSVPGDGAAAAADTAADSEPAGATTVAG